MFIAIPVGMNYRTERLPLVTFSLIGVNTLVWLVSAICFVSTDGASELWIMKQIASTNSFRLWGGILVAMPTAIPSDPIKSRFGSFAG